MRVKEDSGSWKASGVIRRDFRHQHGDPEIPRRRRRRANRTKWCKGDVGKEHEIGDWEPDTKFPFSGHVKRCQRCGKEMHHRYSWGGRIYEY